jgi:hypothetical protein
MHSSLEVLPDDYEEAIIQVKLQDVLCDGSRYYQEILYKNPYTEVVYALRCPALAWSYWCVISVGLIEEHYNDSIGAYRSWMKKCLTP